MNRHPLPLARPCRRLPGPFALLLLAALAGRPLPAQDQYALQFQGPVGRDVSVTRSDLRFQPSAFSSQGDEIVSAAGNLAAAGFTPGMVIRVQGSALNDGLFTLTSVFGNRLVLAVADQLVPEDAAGRPVALSVAWVPRVRVPAVLPDGAEPPSRADRRAAAELDVPVAGSSSSAVRRLATFNDLIFTDEGSAGPDRVQTLAGDFAAAGFAAGTVFAVRGSAANDGLYTVAEVTESEPGSAQFNVLVLTSEAALTPEGDPVTPAEAALLQAASGFTAEAWVKFPEYPEGEFPPKWEAVVTKGRGWAISRYSNTNAVTFSTWTGSEYHDIVSVTGLTPRWWHHVAAVYDGAAKRLYVDGVLAASAAWAGPLLWDDAPLMLGNAPVVAGDARLKEGRALRGCLDVVRLWAVARSPEELAATARRRLRGSEAGLLGEWRFDESPTGPDAASALDSSLNGRTGALFDLDPATVRIYGYDGTLDPPEPRAVVLGAALEGNHALHLDGVSQYALVVNEEIFDFADGFALELWVNLDQLPAAGTEAALISKGPAAYELTLAEDGSVRFRTGGAAAHVLQSVTRLGPGEWHHVAAVWDAGVKTLVLDGAIDAEVYGVPLPLGADDVFLCFGARPLPGNAAEAFFAGLIDDVRAWAVARPADLIAQNRSRTLTGHEPGLAGWWTFDEGDGAVAADVKEVVPKPGSLVTLQFEQLAFAGNELKTYPSPYRENSPDPAIDPDGLADDPWLIENSTGGNTLAVKGQAMPDYPGSTALFNTIPNADTILRMDDGEAFRVLSIDLGDLNSQGQAGTQVTFRALVAGFPVEQTFVLDGGETVPHTFTFRRYNAITELRWRQAANYHLCDNIVLQRLRDLQPCHIKADALLVNLPDWGRVDSPLVFGEPVPPQYALSFDGDGDWVSVAPPAGVPTHFERRGAGGAALPFTLEVWLCPRTVFAGSAPDDTHPFQTVVRQGDVGWGLAVDAAGYLRYWVADDQDASPASDRPLDTGVWQHVALLVNPAANTVAFYINGAPAGDSEMSVVSTDAVNHGLVWGRKGALTEGGWFLGDLDEVRLWDYARDPDEIYAFANRPLPDGMSGLLGCWRLNDGIGDTAVDGSGNSLAAVLHGTAASPDLPTWIYGPQAPNRDGMWALQFDGVDDYLQVPDSLGFNPRADTVRSLSGAFGALGLCPGQEIAVSETVSNNRALCLEVVRPERLVVRPAGAPADPLDALTAEGSEAAPASALLTWNRLLRDALIFEDNGAAPDRIVSLSGSFTPLGLQPGDLVVVRDAGPNNGEYEVAAVQPMAITLTAAASLTPAGNPPPLASATLFRGVRLTDLVFEDNDTAPAELTLEAWVRPFAAAALDPGQAERRRTILMKEQDGWGLALDAEGCPVLLLRGVPAARASAPAARILDGVWQHVAVTVRVSALENEVVFYRNGLPGETQYPAVDLGSSGGPLYIGRQGLGTSASPARHHYKGDMDEVRVWTVARTPAQMAQTAMRQLFRGTQGLAAYWCFNRFDPATLDTYNAQGNYLEVHDEAGNGHTASFGEGVMSVRAYVRGLYDLAWDGDFWDTEGSQVNLDLSRSASSRGLWVGKVVLDAVTEARTVSAAGPGQVTPTADTMAFTILLHVDAAGRVRLLKDVILLRAPGASTEEPLPEEQGLNSSELTPVGQEAGVPAPSHVVLVTDPARLPTLAPVEGSRPRRISAPAYDFEGNELALQGGVGPARAVTGVLVLPRLHPTNPFRHKYHPDHRNINPDDPDYGYEIRRALTISFDPTADGLAIPAGYGIQTLSGTYRETITGLHKAPLTTTGTVELSRISTVGRLNQ